MHEVLDDGHTVRERPELGPNSSPSLWKANRSRFGVGGRKVPSAAKRRASRNPSAGRSRRGRSWLGAAFATHKRGSLHRYLGVPLNERIPVALLQRTEKRLAREHAAATGRRRVKLLSRLREVRLALVGGRISRRAARKRRAR